MSGRKMTPKEREKISLFIKYASKEELDEMLTHVQTCKDILEIEREINE